MNKIINVIKRNLRWIIALLSIIILIAIIEDLLEKDIVSFDNNVYSCISKFISEPLTNIAKIITMLGSVYVVIPIFIIMIIIFWKKKESIWITLNLIIVFVSNQLLKIIVARPRPIGYRLVEELGYSFPSGHSMVSMAFYGFIIYLIYKKVKNQYIKWGLCLTLSLIIFLIGLSRIYLGVHYASDVIAGFCISLTYLTLFTNVIKIDE